MFSNKMDFSSCVIWIDFHKSGHICVLCVQHETSPTIMVGNFGELNTKHIFILVTWTLVNLNIYNVI